MAGKISHAFRPDIRVRLIDARPFFGPGTSALLRAIQECGSVLGACERLELSYSKGRVFPWCAAPKAAWGAAAPA